MPPSIKFLIGKNFHIKIKKTTPFVAQTGVEVSEGGVQDLGFPEAGAKEATTTVGTQTQVLEDPPLPEAPHIGPNNQTDLRAGNLQRYYNNWLNLTNDKFVLSVIASGYKLQFLNRPKVPSPTISTPSSTNYLKIKNEICRLLNYGAIVKTSFNDDQYVSRVFVREKANGKSRLILDLKNLNKNINKIHFRMEDRVYIQKMISKDDFLVSIDLKDAFLSINLHPSSCKFTVFQFNNCRYMYKMLPFGLTSAPRVFSKVLRPVVTQLRSLGIKITAYLDDILIAASSKEICFNHLGIAMKLLQNLGFIINFEKSHMIPTKEIQHLGYIWDSQTMTLALPLEKIQKIVTSASKLLEMKEISLRQLSSFLGMAVSCSPGYDLAPLHYRHIQFCLIKYLHKCQDWDTKIFLTEGASKEIIWWSSFSSSIAVCTS